jgi:hypothetical protein
VKQTAVLTSPQQAHATLSALWSAIKPELADGKRLVVEVKPETRSNDQNALLHALLSDIARQCEWAGRKWDVEEWKRLMTAAWCRTRHEGVQMVPAIDGQGFDVLYQRTSKLTRGECSDLCEYVLAWGADQGVDWSNTDAAVSAG